MSDNGAKRGTGPDIGELLPMGAVARRTGISEHSLRAWERRFGFPRPTRLASGHRRYPEAQVHQLLLINRALELGFRAGDVVSLPLARLQALLSEHDQAGDPAPDQLARRWRRRVIADAQALDQAAVDQALALAAARLGVQRFLVECAVPLLAELGELWQGGEIEVRHEHLVAEVLQGRLRALRRPFEAVASGRPVLLSTLPGEGHGLGLQLVALAISAAGRRTLVLGRQLPVAEIIAAATVSEAAAVGISISRSASPKPTRELVLQLRHELPSTIALWLGGGGVPDLGPLPDSLQCFTSVDQVTAALVSLPA